MTETAIPLPQDEIPTTDAGAPVFFDAILTPHRSLSQTGFAIIMGVLAGVTLAVGTAFFLMGAWPVIGIAGLEIACVYLMIRHSYRTGESSERIVLTDERLELTRTDHRGRIARASLPTAWLTVQLQKPVRPESQLLLSSHGVTISIGSFLAPFEREQLEVALKDALNQARAPVHLR